MTRPDVTLRVLTQHAILELARDHGANLIAMATRGYQRAGRLVLVSVARRVLIGTDVPVLPYRMAQRATP